jgi:hypothetical protein
VKARAVRISLIFHVNAVVGTAATGRPENKNSWPRTSTIAFLQDSVVSSTSTILVLLAFKSFKSSLAVSSFAGW